VAIAYVLRFPISTLSCFSREFEFVAAHIDPAPPECDPFGFEAEALFDRALTSQLDLSSGAEDTMPRQSKRAMQSPGNPASCSRRPRRTRYCAVSRNLTARNLADGAANPLFDGHA
jgi:hypothetical protein